MMTDALTDPRFLQAVLVGLGIAAPVGPIGLLTIRRTLEGGMPAGLATGLGAACADAAYGALGAWGVQAAITWLVSDEAAYVHGAVIPVDGGITATRHV